jgi:hypothetical protein
VLVSARPEMDLHICPVQFRQIEIAFERISAGSAHFFGQRSLSLKEIFDV